MRVQLAASLAILAVAVGGAVFLQDSRSEPSSTSPTGSEAERTGSTMPVPSTAAATSAAVSTTAATSSTTTTTEPASTTADTTVSIAPASPGGSTTAAAITTDAELYFGRPFETIHIPGIYQGVDGPVTLRLQVHKATGWSSFPLPVVTDPSGSFRAYVELGAGRYRLRLVDPSTGTTSEEFKLLLF